MAAVKNDQPGNYETRLGALCTISIITLRVIGMELGGFMALIHGLHIYWDGYESIAWDSHEFKVIHVYKLEVTLKISISALLTLAPKPFTVWIMINCGKFFKRWEYQTTLPAS